jgi:hypothetical protein
VPRPASAPMRRGVVVRCVAADERGGRARRRRHAFALAHGARALLARGAAHAASRQMRAALRVYATVLGSQHWHVRAVNAEVSHPPAPPRAYARRAPCAEARQQARSRHAPARPQAKAMAERAAAADEAPAPAGARARA